LNRICGWNVLDWWKSISSCCTKRQYILFELIVWEKESNLNCYCRLISLLFYVLVCDNNTSPSNGRFVIQPNNSHHCQYILSELFYQRKSSTWVKKDIKENIYHVRNSWYWCTCLISKVTKLLFIFFFSLRWGGIEIRPLQIHIHQWWPNGFYPLYFFYLFFERSLMSILRLIITISVPLVLEICWLLLLRAGSLLM
jgi:magnesium-transporting ATPase (P-type)